MEKGVRVFSEIFFFLFEEEDEDWQTGLRLRIEKPIHHRAVWLVCTTFTILATGGETTTAKLICRDVAKSVLGHDIIIMRWGDWQAVTTGSDRRCGACVSWFAAAGSWQKTRSLQGIICSNVEKEEQIQEV